MINPSFRGIGFDRIISSSPCYALIPFYESAMLCRISCAFFGVSLNFELMHMFSAKLMMKRWMSLKSYTVIIGLSSGYTLTSFYYYC